MSKELAIVLTPAENHFVHIEQLVKSIEKNTSINFHVCILAQRDGMSLGNRKNVTIKTVTPEHLQLFESIYCSENKRGDIPAFVYSQIVAPSYFKEFEKLLFLEVDQFVNNDLSDLWKLVYEKDIKLGAVQVPEHQIPEHFVRDFPSEPYFNTGVVVYDTKHWIKSGATEKCLEECRKQKKQDGGRFRFYVQGAMNNALKGDFFSLDTKFNVMGLGGKGVPQEELDNGVILHWNGKRKPWNSDGAYKEIYYSV